jgi:L,D-peptidoglycan transpeptidase YkuD (ErfK/YbiS/YcfS/YnhG family)
MGGEFVYGELVRARTTCLLVAFLCLAASPSPSKASGSVRFRIPARARQLIVVSSQTYEPAGDLATFRAYARSGADSPWRRVFPDWQAETGYGHLRDVRHERDGSTPTGVFGFGSTIYGTEPDPGGLHYRYHRLLCGDWWDEDPFSPRYNRFVHVPCALTPGFAARSESLWTATVAYRYFAVIRFNVDPVRGGADAPGSGIFLHAWVGGATAGCVALPEAKLLKVLWWLDPKGDPVIEIGTTAEVAASLG